MALNLSLTTLYVSFEMLDTPHINDDIICERILSVNTDEHYASLPFLFEQMAIDCHSVLYHHQSASARSLLIDTLVGDTSSSALDYMIKSRDKHISYLENQLNSRIPSAVYRKCLREHAAAQRLFTEQHTMLTEDEFDFLYDLAHYTDYRLKKDHGMRHTKTTPRM